MQTSLTVKPRGFRELCADHGFTATHQRQVLYEVMQTMPGHPSTEEVYARVKKCVPAISIATVYKNIHLFVERGVLKELSMHHGSIRVELNGHHHHHHTVCSHCKAIADIEEKDLGVLPTVQGLPGGFQVERYSIDVIGICAACQKAKTHLNLISHPQFNGRRRTARKQNTTPKGDTNGQRTDRIHG